MLGQKSVILSRRALRISKARDTLRRVNPPPLFFQTRSNVQTRIITFIAWACLSGASLFGCSGGDDSSGAGGMAGSNGTGGIQSTGCYTTFNYGSYTPGATA